MNYEDYRQTEFWDFLALFTACLQIMDYNATMRQSSNDDLMEEMRKQDSEYLQRIIRQNDEIIKHIIEVKNEVNKK